MKTASLALLLLLCGSAALADDEVQPAPRAEEDWPVFRDGVFRAAFYYFQRYRDRYDVGEDRYQVNLSHATGQLALSFESGWVADFLGFDLAIFGGYDFYNRGDPEHEMDFFPRRDPWTPYNASAGRAKDGASVYQALVKMKAGPFWARAGYFQPQGPGVLGVNWSFLPGVYQGAEMGAAFGGWTLAAAWANQYKAPWYNEIYKFKRNDGRTEVSSLWSLGARYQATERLSLEAAYGQSRDYLWNAHFKLKYRWPLAGDRLSLSWQLYLMNDLGFNGPVNDNFSGLAQHHFLAAGYETGPWNFNLEFLYTKAPNDHLENAGYFAYRLISRYGGANGAYEPWWDLRSDWNHHEEKAVFVKIRRSFDDLGLPGFSAAVSHARGWGGRALGFPGKLREAACGLDLSYTVPEGFLAGSVVALHCTYYDNLTDIPSWRFFHNAFQDEHDIKLSVIIPLAR